MPAAASVGTNVATATPVLSSELRKSPFTAAGLFVLSDHGPVRENLAIKRKERKREREKKKRKKRKRKKEKEKKRKKRKEQACMHEKEGHVSTQSEIKRDVNGGDRSQISASMAKESQCMQNENY